MLKRFFLFSSFLLAFSLLFQPNISNAEETNDSGIDLSKEAYQQLIDEGILDKNTSYDEWVEMNDESLFDELDNDFPPEQSMEKATTQGFKLKKGDILVSNGTSSKGLTGHAGIVVSNNKILHIAGPGKKVQEYTVNKWQKRYGIIKGQKDGKTRTKVYRINSASKAGVAGKWAESSYKGKTYKYGTGGKLTSKNPTYCSKIVWQAYNYVGVVNKPKNTIIMPYSLPNSFKSSAKVKMIGIL